MNEKEIELLEEALAVLPLPVWGVRHDRLLGSIRERIRELRSASKVTDLVGRVSKDDTDLIERVYLRMKNVYKENENSDYMLRLKGIVGSLRACTPVEPEKEYYLADIRQRSGKVSVWLVKAGNVREAEKAVFSKMQVGDSLASLLKAIE